MMSSDKKQYEIGYNGHGDITIYQMTTLSFLQQLNVCSVNN